MLEKSSVQAPNPLRGWSGSPEPCREAFVQPVRIPIPQQEGAREKQHAGAPHRRASAEPGQNHLGDHGLDLKQQEGPRISGQDLPGLGSGEAGQAPTHLNLVALECVL